MKKLSQLKSWLNKPYPMIEDKKKALLFSFFFALFIFLFLLIFQPFGISEITHNKLGYLSGYFFITFGIMLISNILLPQWFETFFSPDHWTVKKNIISVLLHTLVIGLLNYEYNQRFGTSETTYYGPVSFILLTIAVGIFPIIFTIFFIERHLRKKHQRFASELNEKIEHSGTNPENIPLILRTESKNETLRINSLDFLCARSEGNYVAVFFRRGEHYERKLIRSSLTNIEEQLSSFEYIKRCHRSYLANLHRVDDISGNSRNYNLKIKHLDFSIPISRSYQREILSYLKNR